MTSAAVVFLASLLGSGIHAQPALKTVTWGPGKKISIGTFDCAAEKVSMILVQGDIELVHPQDTPNGQPPQIFIKCDRVIFAQKSKVRTRAALYIRAETSITGAIDIENTRAVHAADATDDPAIYKPSKAGNGSNGGPGGNGNSAVFSSMEYPGGNDAGNGGPGENATRGGDGRTGDPASSARDGTASASVTLKTFRYGPGTTVVINTRGGNGGKGSQGGRGQDGGDGGIGGDGGRGGNAAEGRTAGNGGNGGRGGDGGHGGRGGAGGDGGNGGRGGNISVLVIDDGKKPVGQPPSDITALLEGGIGGEPGVGGPGGAKGKGMRGGLPGCGGDGAGFIKAHPKGACGQQGDKGIDGRDGDPGPIGKFGVNGPPGKWGEGTFGYVVEKDPK